MPFAINFIRTTASNTNQNNKRGWFSFYKGVPTFYFENDFISSFSFGFIFINTKYEKENTLDYEWGHTRQMLLLGVGDFFNMIGLPSIITNLIDRDYEVDYYNMPWEITADMFGEVTRDVHTDTAKNIGVAYLATSEFVSNTFVKPMMLPVYTTAAALLDGVIPGLGTTLLTIMYTS